MPRTISLRDGIEELLTYKENNRTSDISGNIDLNYLTTEGKYYIQDDSTVANLPYYASSGPFYIEVFNSALSTSNVIYQKVTSVTDGISNIRFSSNNGTTWGAWKYIQGYPTDGAVPFYICIDATNGNDNNDGLSQGTPIRSVTELHRRLATANGPVEIYLGPGNYGTLMLSPKFTIQSYYLGPLYDNQALPHLDQLIATFTVISIEGLDCDYIAANRGTQLTILPVSSSIPECTVGALRVFGGSYLSIEKNITIKPLTSAKMQAYGLSAIPGCVYADGGYNKLYLNGAITFIPENLFPAWVYADSGSIILGGEIEYRGTFTEDTSRSVYVYRFLNYPSIFANIHSTYGFENYQYFSDMTPGFTTKSGGYRSFDSLYAADGVEIGYPITLRALDTVKGTLPASTKTVRCYQCTDKEERASPGLADCYTTIDTVLYSSGSTALSLMAIKNTAESTSRSEFQISSSGYTQGPSHYPSATNKYNLGYSSRLWNEIFCANDTINTSDARLKNNVFDIPAVILDSWKDVRLKVFQMKDAIESKGEERARWHSGVIAQEIKQVFEEKDIDPTRYAFFCYDQWEASNNDTEVIIKPAEKDENGNIVKEAVTETKYDRIEAGDRYSIRYSEFLIIEAAYQRRENERLKERMSVLENEVAELKALVQQLVSNQQ